METSTTTEPEPPEAMVEQELESADGWRYSVRITPIGTSPDGSPGGCIETAPPGRTNLIFEMEVENLIDDRAAPWPNLVTGLNMDGFANQVVEAGNVEQSDFSTLEITPADPDGSCLLAFGIGPGIGTEQREIGAGATEEFTIVAGSPVEPLPDGIELLVRGQQVANGDENGRLDWTVPFED